MRGNRKLGLILLLVTLAVPAYGQSAPGQPPDKTVTLFGQSIHYFEMGSGPVVVLLHGLGSRKEDWLRGHLVAVTKRPLSISSTHGVIRTNNE